MQLALLGALQTPALQLKLAVPVAGSTASRTAAFAPETVLGKLALQLWAPSTHIATCAGQAAAGGAAHEAWLAALQVPLLQVKFAAPVKGRAASLAITGLPEAVSWTVAEQLLPATVQLSVCAAQAAGGGRLQEALLAAAHTPALQAKLAVPVAGCT